jgi:hypothetical protein
LFFHFVEAATFGRRGSLNSKGKDKQMKWKWIRGLHITTFVILLAVLSFRSVSFAAPLNLDLPVTPNIFTGTVDVSYHASTDRFLANGVNVWVELAPTEIHNFIPQADNFLIEAIIDQDGHAINGSLSVTGTVPSLGISGNLLSGDLFDFGYTETGSLFFEFVFDNLSGELAYLFTGTDAGVKIGGGDTSFAGSFLTDFGTIGDPDGLADTAPIVPIPGSLVLMASGLSGLFVIRKRVAHRFF